MKNGLLYIFIIMAIVPAIAAENPTIEMSTDNTTWVNVSISYDDNNTALIMGLDPGTSYYFRSKNSTHGWGHSNEQYTKLGGDDIMTFLGIILTPLVLGFFFLYGASSLGDDHHALKILLFLLSMPMVWVSLHFATIVVAKFYNIPALIDIMGTTTYVLAIVWLAIVSYFALYAIYKGFLLAGQHKKEKLEY